MQVPCVWQAIKCCMQPCASCALTESGFWSAGTAGPLPSSHSTEGCSPSTQAQSCAMKHILRAGISTSEPLVLADNVQSHVLLVCFDESSGKPQLVIKPSQQQQHQQLYQAVRLLRFVPGCVLGCDRPLVCSFWWRKDAGWPRVLTWCCCTSVLRAGWSFLTLALHARWLAVCLPGCLSCWSSVLASGPPHLRRHVTCA